MLDSEWHKDLPSYNRLFFAQFLDLSFSSSNALLNY